MSNNKNEQSFDYITYGETCRAEQVKMFIQHMVDSNKDDEKPTPLCIWGTAGIGKTSIVEQIAKEKGFQFVSIAPAQFEEMGDLLGMPYVDKETGDTKFAIPEWVPTQEGPGIILFDDVNRADDRILRGIMQLLQNYELISWKLPKGWQIVLTANPDGGDYSVTTMDNAMLTRMMHITMEFDVKEWARWAEMSKVDQRGINFLLKYPELVDTEQCNPRSFTAFFNSIKNIKDLKSNIPLVNILAKSTLTKNVAVQFQQFINDNLIDLINPEEILTAKNFESVKKIIEKQIKPIEEAGVRNDIANIITTRFCNYVIHDLNKKFNDVEINNMIEFLKLEIIPKDMSMSTIRDFTSLSKKIPSLKKVVMAPGVMDKVITQL